MNNANLTSNEGVLRLDIDHFSQFCLTPNCFRFSEAKFIQGLPWNILAKIHIKKSLDLPPEYFLAVYLQCKPKTDSQYWSCATKATIRIINCVGGQDIVFDTHHTFTYRVKDWGYGTVALLNYLENPNNGFIYNDTVRVEVHVSADAPQGLEWDRGFVGLKNLGATCYMNSLLQSFFFTGALRKAVFSMPVINEQVTRNVTLALQRVFYYLMNSTEPVGTRRLTMSFGWSSIETIMQQDVQEFCRVLLDNLETKMKGSSVENVIPSLFKGKMRTFIRCLNVPYESGRTENFYDIQLNVKGKKTIYESLQEYTALEVLDGANKYDAGIHGHQPAEKYTKFSHLPPILHLHLMRFQYLGSEQKINDRFEFPEELNLFEFSEGVNPEDCLYNLHAVLVHSGNVRAGHYVVYINTNLHERTQDAYRPKWHKFDDDLVSQTSVQNAVMDNYGGIEQFTSAYMLVYVKKQAIAAVLNPPREEEVPQQLVEIFRKEATGEASRKMDTLGGARFTELSIVTPDLLQLNTSFELIIPKTIEEKASRMKFRSSLSVADFYRQLRNALFSDNSEIRKDSNFRVWAFARSFVVQPGTDYEVECYRPSVWIDENRKDKTIGDVLTKDGLVVYIEHPLQPHCNPNFDESEFVLVFIKAYDGERKKMMLLGHTVLCDQLTLNIYHDHFCELAGWSNKTALRIYEEASVQFVREINEMNIPINSESCIHSFKDGMILIIEDRNTTSVTNNAYWYLENVYESVTAEFVMNNDGVSNSPATMENFTATIKLSFTMRMLAELIASKIGCATNNVLIFDFGNSMQRNFVTMDLYFDPSYRVSNFLGFEGSNYHDPCDMTPYDITFAIIPFNFAQIELRYWLKVQAMDQEMNESQMILWPKKTEMVSNILELASQDFKFAANGTGKLRLLHVGISRSNRRVFGCFNDDTYATEIQQKAWNFSHTVRIEEIPHDQVYVGPSECLVSVSHFEREPHNMFGVPFLFKISDQETRTSIRDRLRTVLGVPMTEFRRYKVVLLSRDRSIRYLDLDAAGALNLAELGFQLGQSRSAFSPFPYLCLDHPKKQYQKSFEMSVQIRH